MSSRLSGERWNRITDEIVKRYRELVEMYKNELLADGYPPFHVPLTPQEQYQRLVAMQQAGDPLFYSDPSAGAKLAELSQRFGPPPPVAPPFGGVL